MRFKKKGKISMYTYTLDVQIHRPSRHRDEHQSLREAALFSNRTILERTV